MFTRLGFVARGIAYIVIGTIAVMVVFGIARHEPGSPGGMPPRAAAGSDCSLCCLADGEPAEPF